MKLWILLFFLGSVLGQQQATNCPSNCLKCDRQGKCICTVFQYGRCQQCLPGFRGHDCNSECPPGRFGFDCAQGCHCSKNGTTNRICDPGTGVCDCQPEYGGKDCGILLVREQRLKEIVEQQWGEYWLGCVNKCQNGGICDPLKKTCFCPPGYFTENCSLRCWAGYFGENCTQKCNCQRNMDCDHISGSCICQNETFGKYCEFSKPEVLAEIKNNFLADMLTGCNKNCNNHGICNIYTKKCECFLGYRGDFCETACDNGFFGKNCTGVCNCLNNSTCDFATGRCSCIEGWIGPDCGFSVQLMEERLVPKYIFYLILMGVGIFIAACLVVIQGMCIYLICRRYSKKKVRDTAINDFDERPAGFRNLPPVPPFDQSLNMGSLATPFGSSMIGPTYAQPNRKREMEASQQATEIYSNTSELSASLHYQEAFQANQNVTPIEEDRFC